MAIEIPHKKTASFSVSDIRHTDTNRMPHRSSANFLNGMMISYSFFHLCSRIIAACSRSCSSFSGLSFKSVRFPCPILGAFGSSGDMTTPKSFASLSQAALRKNTLRLSPVLEMASKISRETMMLIFGDSFFISVLPFNFAKFVETRNKKPLD